MQKTTSADNAAKLLNKFGTHTIAPSEIMDSIHDYFVGRDISSKDDSSSNDTDSDSDAENADLSYTDIKASLSSLNEEPVAENRTSSSTALNEEPMIMNRVSSTALNEEPMIMNRALLTALNEKPVTENHASSTALNEEPMIIEFDVMIAHENKLNDLIVAQLSAFLHRDQQLMCSNRAEDKNSLKDTDELPLSWL